MDFYEVCPNKWGDTMPIKDAFEMFMKIFHGDGTKLVKDA
jgi:hypothetical protein